MIRVNKTDNNGNFVKVRAFEGSCHSGDMIVEIESGNENDDYRVFKHTVYPLSKEQSRLMAEALVEVNRKINGVD